MIEVCSCAVSIDAGPLGVLPCSEPQVAVIDVPVFGPNSDRHASATVELAVCAEHLRILHESRDPIEQARKWLL